MRRFGKRERGSVSIELAMVIGLLLFPTAMLVMQVPNWIEKKQLADEVALRSAVVCTHFYDLGEGQAVARAALAGVLSEYDTPDVLSASVACRDSTGDGRVTPGEAVSASATIIAPAISIPVRLSSWRLTSTHVEQVSPHQSVDR